MLNRRYDATVTMFVFLRGRPVLEYYFGLRNAACAANDPSARALAPPPAALRSRTDR